MGRPYGKVNHDLTNARFGRYLVLKREGSNKWGAPLWRCRCDCGIEKLVMSSALRMGIVVSCGCYQRDVVKHLRYKHGLSHSKTYRCWGNMIQRCTNPNNHHYPSYGGRGIKVCQRWLKFDNFLSDMGICPPNLTIERMDNDGSYTPRNCCWATIEQQRSNKSPTRHKKREKHLLVFRTPE